MSSSPLGTAVGGALVSPPTVSLADVVAALARRPVTAGDREIARARIVDPKFPGLAGGREAVEMQEEWYSMTNFAPDLHALLVLDPATMRNPYPDVPGWPPAGSDTPYQRPPYPVTWAHPYGAGRVFYTALGHGEPTWRNPQFQDIVFGGLDWVLHRADVDLTPNLAQVAPRAAELPPPSAPVSGLPPELKKLEGQTPAHTFP